MSLASLWSETVSKLRGGPAVVSAAAATPAVQAFPDVSEAPPDSRRMIRQRQYCRVVSTENELQFDAVSQRCAWKALEYEMAFVPEGELDLDVDWILSDDHGLGIESAPSDPVFVGAFYMDRHCVTNADFARFVQAGGYDDPDHWPAAILSQVLRFVDQTGKPGPKYWVDGAPLPDRLDHPVVGISWYEASAYAAWVGKRLPSSSQWQHCGTWGFDGGGDNATSVSPHYPWGNAFDPTKVNVWDSGIRDTVAVCRMPEGQTINGVHQLIGNVWEWVDTQFQPVVGDEVSLVIHHPMAEVRGGAFDTYFHSHTTNQFRTGHPLLFRGHNVGFRCCVPVELLTPPPSDATPSDVLPSELPSMDTDHDHLHSPYDGENETC